MEPVQIAETKIVKEAVSNAHFIYSRDIHVDQIFLDDYNTRALGLRAVLVIPVVSKSGTIGVMYLDANIVNSDQLQRNIDLLIEIVEEAALSAENVLLYTNLNTVFIEVVRSLTSAVDAKDPLTYGHSERVMFYSLAIGKEIGLNDSELRDLELAALLHDIGKLGISQGILDSPSVLNDMEFKEVKNHPFIGAQILSPIKKFNNIWKAVLQHHERFDGKGYPYHIKGPEINIMARIISVADALDAMVNDRPYQKAVPIYEAVVKLRENSGSQFDPEIVAAVERLYRKNALDKMKRRLT